MTTPETPTTPPTLAGQALFSAIARCPAHALTRAVRGLSLSDVPQVRNGWAGWARSREFATLQDAWAAYVQAVGGRVTFTPSRCSSCHGKRWSTRNVGRNLARTGHPAVCGDCRGTGRGSSTRAFAVPHLQAGH